VSWVVGAVLVVAVGAGAALWARRRLVLVTVDGSSMEPSLDPQATGCRRAEKV
jgi:hypothetical protein